jgi:hypothetical protein
MEKMREDVTNDLPEPTPSAGDIPKGILPRFAERIINHISSAVGCLRIFPLSALLVTLSCLLARHYLVRPKKGNLTYTVSPNLSGIVIADPGQKKSPGIAGIIDTFKQAEAELAAAFSKQAKDKNAAYVTALNKNKVYEKNVRDLLVLADKAKDHPERALEYERLAHEEAQKIVACQKPTPLRLSSTDTTYMGIVKIMRYQVQPILIYQDEIASLFTRVKSSSTAGATLRSFLLQTMDGRESNVPIDRATAEASYILPLPITSILGTIQPSRLADFIRTTTGTFSHDGFYNRFQVWSFPDPDIKVIRDTGAATDFKSLEVLKTIINSLLPSSPFASTKSRDRKIITMTDEAEQTLELFKNNLDENIQSLSANEFYTSHVSKYESFICSLALIIHSLKLVSNLRTDPRALLRIRQITKEDIVSAGKLVIIFDRHIRKTFEIQNLTVKTAHKILECSDRLDDEFTTRDVYKNGWSIIGRNKGRALAGLNLLHDHGFLKKELRKNPKGGGEIIYWIKVKKKMS